MIGSVLAVLLESAMVNEIIVVDDGSTDRTAECAKTAGVHVIRQDHAGKGAAMRQGARATKADILLFADADLIGLKDIHIRDLVAPVVSGDADLTVGLRDRGAFVNWLMRTVLPLIGGERVLSREHFLELSKDCDDFGIESTMNAYMRKRGLCVRLVALKGVSHVIKEKKYGLVTGFFHRCKMIAQVVRTELELIVRK